MKGGKWQTCEAQQSRRWPTAGLVPRGALFQMGSSGRNVFPRQHWKALLSATVCPLSPPSALSKPTASPTPPPPLLPSQPASFPLPDPTADHLGREDEGFRQDSEEQVQVQAVLQQAPSERVPARSVGAGGRERRDVSPTCPGTHALETGGCTYTHTHRHTHVMQIHTTHTVRTDTLIHTCTHCIHTPSHACLYF